MSGVGVGDVQVAQGQLPPVKTSTVHPFVSVTVGPGAAVGSPGEQVRVGSHTMSQIIGGVVVMVA
jgi:hypothetical protein